MTEIRSLLDQPAGGGGPPRELVEKTLTDGYAHALQIEAEQLRVQGELRAAVRAPRRNDARISELTVVLQGVDRRLAGLRRLLVALRAHGL